MLLYCAYQAQTDALAPWRLFADAARGLLDQPWPGVPVVLASGYPEVPGDELGVPRLSKPYRQEELARLLASMVGSEPPPVAIPPAAA